ncbi:ANT [Symbiodinium natans]|uniref:ANT protein n=1 Tax=Symbiodinium natans TaxID=878477 RepID=A0A812KZK7_9DINO|nr:ANT [Symbiodinium natans]
MDLKSRKKHHLGLFEDEIAAAARHDAARVALRGPGSQKNFPKKLPTEHELLEVQVRLATRPKASSYSGVYPKGSGWVARIKKNGTSLHLGSFADELDAAKAYDAALRSETLGPTPRSQKLASLNFLEESDFFSECSWQDEPIPAGKTSRFMGVYYHAAAQKYCAKAGGKHLGTFATELQAARAFDAASLAGAGRTNFAPVSRELVSSFPRSGRGRRAAGRQSQFRGVTWHAVSGKWRARIAGLDSTREVHLGTFETEQDAAARYDAATVVLRLPVCKRNFPSRVPADNEILQAKQRLAKEPAKRGYKGVDPCGSGRFQARVMVNGRSRYLGTFDSELEAARVYDKAIRCRDVFRSIRLFSLNFPKQSDYFNEESWQNEPVPAGRTSRFLGVSKHKGKHVFQATCQRKFLGYFQTELQAAKAFDAASAAVGGPTNFPNSASTVQSNSWLHVLPTRLTEPQLVPLAEKLESARGSPESESTESQRSSCCSSRFAPDDLIHVVPWPFGVPAPPGLEVEACVLPERMGGTAGMHALPDGVSTKAFGTRKLIEQLDDRLAVFAPAAFRPDCWSLNSDFHGNEAQVRMVLDLILVHFCRRHALRLAAEVPLPESSPFAGKADYALFDGNSPIAIVEAKRCLGPSVSAEARHALFVAAMAQSCAVLAGFLSATPTAPLLAIVTDARGWLLVHLTAEKKPVLQLWPQGQAILELRSPVELAQLLQNLQQLLGGEHLCEVVRLEFGASELQSLWKHRVFERQVGDSGEQDFPKPRLPC